MIGYAVNSLLSETYGVVPLCYQHHNREGIDKEVPQFHTTQSEPLDLGIDHSNVLIFACKNSFEPPQWRVKIFTSYLLNWNFRGGNIEKKSFKYANNF